MPTFYRPFRPFGAMSPSGTNQSLKAYSLYYNTTDALSCAASAHVRDCTVRGGETVLRLARAFSFVSHQSTSSYLDENHSNNRRQ